MRFQGTMVLATVLIIAVVPRVTMAATALSDQELDAITAGNFSVFEESFDLVRLDFLKHTVSGKKITGDLSFTVLRSVDEINFGTLNLSDNAQSNLTSLVNINAVNSPVTVLLNLNINIDSQVGSINQINLTIPTVLPSITPWPGH